MTAVSRGRRMATLSSAFTAPAVAAPALLHAMVILLSGGAASAQEDFRSLDAGRPLKVTDAFPKKYLESEFQFGLQSEWTEGGRRSVQGLLELETGLFRNFEIGAGLEVATEDDGTNAVTGFQALGVEALYNFKHEGWRWPGIAIQAGVEAPTGGALSREDWAVGADLVLSQSFPNRLRVHVNGGYAVSSNVDGGDYWRGGLALDVPMGFSSRLIMGDVYTEIPVGAGPTRMWVELGTRLQVTNLTVIDVGLSTRLDEWDRGAANLGLVFGFSRVFGIGGLVRVPEYPNPRIR
jgi:hypothetical protein